jgi:hypothetical protein
VGGEAGCVVPAPEAAEEAPMKFDHSIKRSEKAMAIIKACNVALRNIDGFPVPGANPRELLQEAVSHAGYLYQEFLEEEGKARR